MCVFFGLGGKNLGGVFIFGVGGRQLFNLGEVAKKSEFMVSPMKITR